MDEETLGDALRQIRERRGMTVQEVADLMGVAKSQVSRLENNKRHLTLDKVHEWADALNARVEVVVYDYANAPGLVETLGTLSPGDVTLIYELVRTLPHMTDEARQTVSALLLMWRSR